MEEETVHVQEFTYKSLNSDLVKSIQAMKIQNNEYKREINNLNSILISEHSRSVSEKKQIITAFENFIKCMFEKTLDFIDTFDIDRPESQIEAENINNGSRRRSSARVSPNLSRLKVVGRSSLEEKLAEKISPTRGSVTRRRSSESRPDVVESESESEGNAESEVPDPNRNEPTEEEDSEYQDCAGNEAEIDEADDRDSRLMTIIPEEDTLIDSTAPSDIILTEASVPENSKRVYGHNEVESNRISVLEGTTSTIGSTLSNETAQSEIVVNSTYVFAKSTEGEPVKNYRNLGSNTFSTTNRSSIQSPQNTIVLSSSRDESDEDNLRQNQAGDRSPIPRIVNHALRKMRDSQQVARVPLRSSVIRKDRSQINSTSLGPPSLYAKSRLLPTMSPHQSQSTTLTEKSGYEISATYNRLEASETVSQLNQSSPTREVENRENECHREIPKSSKKQDNTRNPRRRCMFLGPRISVNSESDDTSDEVAEINKRPLSAVSMNSNFLNRDDTTMFCGFTSTSTPLKSSNSTLKSDKLVVKIEKLSQQQITRLSTNLSSRPKRAATPTNLKEPNLKEKMRCNDNKEPKKKKLTKSWKRANSASSDNDRKARLRGCNSESSDND